MINTATDRMIAQIPVGRNPVDIAYSPDGALPLHGQQRGQLGHGDRHRGQPGRRQVPTGKAPTSISVLPNGRQAYVTDENDGTIEIINLPK